MKKITFALVAMLAAQTAFAQGRGGRGGPPVPPATPKAAATIDVTGYWVSVVTEDWRYRMVTPACVPYRVSYGSAGRAALI